MNELNEGGESAEGVSVAEVRAAARRARLKAWLAHVREVLGETGAEGDEG